MPVGGGEGERLLFVSGDALQLLLLKDSVNKICEEVGIYSTSF